MPPLSLLITQSLGEYAEQVASESIGLGKPSAAE